MSLPACSLPHGERCCDGFRRVPFLLPQVCCSFACCVFYFVTLTLSFLSRALLLSLGLSRSPVALLFSDFPVANGDRCRGEISSALFQSVFDHGWAPVSAGRQKHSFAATDFARVLHFRDFKRSSSFSSVQSLRRFFCVVFLSFIRDGQSVLLLGTIRTLMCSLLLSLSVESSILLSLLLGNQCPSAPFITEYPAHDRFFFSSFLSAVIVRASFLSSPPFEARHSSFTTHAALFDTCFANHFQKKIK